MFFFTTMSDTSSNSSVSTTTSISSTGSDSSFDDDMLILTVDELLRHGLKLLGWTDKLLDRKSKYKHEKQTHLFKCDFGACPQVVAQIFEDLQTTTIAAARIHNATMDDVSHLLYTLNFLKAYPTEGQRQNKWHISDRSLRDNSWDLLLRLQALKPTKIAWPSNDEIGDNVWIGTVDGTHIKTQEPNHSLFPKDPKAFSYKNQSAGLSYEIVVSLWASRIIWINGPYPASVHDNTIFAKPGGLKEKLQGTGLRVIGDSGYQGFDEVSRLNSHDSREVSKFKTRARLRQESVNARLKTMRCLGSSVFRHNGKHTDGQPKFTIFFEAAVVVTQYKLEISEPLFDI